MTKEKAIETIVKLLNVTTDRGASESEAINAALKAQRLMAKYDIDLEEVDTSNKNDDITEEKVDVGTGNKWKYFLAKIVADNFCCKFFVYGKSIMVFYGYKRHATVAKSVFEFLFNVGNKLASSQYYMAQKEGYNTKGVKNSFLAGYIAGIKEVLEKQCRSLMIVTPKEVEESYKEMASDTLNKKITSSVSFNKEAEAYTEGKKRGREVANSRYIEGGE